MIPRGAFNLRYDIRGFKFQFLKLISLKKFQKH